MTNPLSRRISRVEWLLNDPFGALGFRVSLILKRAGFYSKSDVENAFDSGALAKAPDVGKKTIDAVAIWLGRPVVDKSSNSAIKAAITVLEKNGYKVHKQS